MNNKILGFFGVLIVLFLLFEIGPSIIKNQRNDAAEAELKKGKLVEGYEVDFETEKRLSDDSIAKAEEETKGDSVDRFIYTFHMCIGAKSNECLTNLLSENLKNQVKQAAPKGDTPGEALYHLIAADQAITRIEAEDAITVNGITSYTMNVHLLNEKYAKKFTVQFNDTRITTFNSESRDQ